MILKQTEHNGEATCCKKETNK